MTPTIPVAAVIFGLAFALCPAFAAGPDRSGGSTSSDGGGSTEGDEFSALDLNGDGMVSRGEVYLLASLARRFNAADTNGDGEISRSEFSAFEMRIPQDQPALPKLQGTLAQWQLFATLDKDGDDTISPGEAQLYTELQRDFPEADSNDSGTVDRAEFAAFQYRQQYEKYTSPQEGFE